MLIMAIVLSISHLWAQERTITGKVTDDKGGPIPAASILAKGTNLGTSSASDGSFSIKVPSTVKALIISSIGLGEKEISLTASNDYPITLSTKAGDMTEVVVVAYGTKKKTDLTGSVSTVKGADLENKPFTSVDKALQGAVAGLQSVAASGAPGANQQIRIRGISSITASNAPLWIIDGVPALSNDLSRQTTSREARLKNHWVVDHRSDCCRSSEEPRVKAVHRNRRRGVDSQLVGDRQSSLSEIRDRGGRRCGANQTRNLAVAVARSKRAHGRDWCSARLVRPQLWHDGHRNNVPGQPVRYELW